MAEEHYQNKYNFIFHENANCTILNDNHFDGPVTITAGDAKNLVNNTREHIKEAIEKLDSEGILTSDIQWWAIYRVLTLKQFGFPTKKKEFCDVIERMKVETSVRCVYDNWRNYTPNKLTATPEIWGELDGLSTSEQSLQAVGVRFLQLLS